MIGFTGTREGTTEEQRAALELVLKSAITTNSLLLEAMGTPSFHHGDCLGADAEADEIARRLGFLMEIHPPSDDTYRAFCQKPGDTVHAPLPYLERNKEIVQPTDWLIACPRAGVEVLRSGTWSTVRYARDRKVFDPFRVILIINPNGTVIWE